MAISLDKIQQQAPGLLSLAKEAKTSIDKYNLNGQKAKVCFVADFSGSMNGQYRSGKVQKLAERILSLAVQLDDDGAIDFFVFDTSAAYLGEIALGDYAGAIDRLTKGRHMGTTDYAGAFYAVRDHFFPGTQVTEKKGLFGKKKLIPATNTGPANEPVFAIFVTDGAPNSKPAAIKAITEVAASPIFWKFLSIGKEDFSFLQKLDDLDDRFVDNADYKNIGTDVDSLPSNELYDQLLDEYPTWLAEVRAKGLIR